MHPAKQLSGLGKIDRRRFLGAAALGGIWTSLNLQLASRARAEEPPLVAEPKIGELDHAAYMRRAIIQANKNPRLPFGAVIVKGNDGSIVAEGHNRTPLNPTYHGEIDAIDQYASRHPSADWSKLVLYTTCEPCPMCQSAVMWAGIGAVVYGTSMPFIAKLGWWQIDIRAEEVVKRTSFRECRLIGGVLEQECDALFVAALKLSALDGGPHAAGRNDPYTAGTIPSRSSG
jgi:tRNA(adenine34) deaminase